MGTDRWGCGHRGYLAPTQGQQVILEPKLVAAGRVAFCPTTLDRRQIRTVITALTALPARISARRPAGEILQTELT